MALKVFDLACEHGHVFEAWFRSHEEYEQQLQAGWLVCPVCNSSELTKKLSAPHLNLRHGVSSSPQDSTSSEKAKISSDRADTARTFETMQAQFWQQIKHAIKHTDDVGTEFAQEARKIHEGEAPERAIRGSATHEEYESLREDGIAVVAIPDYLDEDKLN